MLVLAAAAVLLAACGSPGSGGSSSAGSCAARSPSALMQAARLVFSGTMLPGPAVSAGGGSVLLSPARVRVARYLKGSGPGIVTVQTVQTAIAAAMEHRCRLGQGGGVKNMEIRPARQERAAR